MARTVHIDGLRDLDKALAELPKATGRNVLRRVLMRRGQPIADAANAGAPVGETGHLAQSGAVTTKLSKRQARLQRQATGGVARMTAQGFRSDPKSDVTVFVGFPSSPKSIVQEFGSADQTPQPFMRPAWDGGKDALLAGIKSDLWAEIKKAAARLARRQAKAAAKG